ncbi:hypothetical protein SAY87_004381 [Trapa incisa]|uniref:Uncharacterized protein n=1 Tax=Trapa incisa TaxID=236973 RepID=A0AAN7JNU9_9MYRT|nr:hypothetical protein SAY87_004381 [Trapa incisa]
MKIQAGHSVVLLTISRNRNGSPKESIKEENKEVLHKHQNSRTVTCQKNGLKQRAEKKKCMQRVTVNSNLIQINLLCKMQEKGDLGKLQAFLQSSGLASIALITRSWLGWPATSLDNGKPAILLSPTFINDIQRKHRLEDSEEAIFMMSIDGLASRV